MCYWFLMEDNVGITLRQLPASLHGSFMADAVQLILLLVLIWSTIQLKVGIVVNTTTGLHCCISISH